MNVSRKHSRADEGPLTEMVDRQLAGSSARVELSITAVSARVIGVPAGLRCGNRRLAG